MRIQRVSYFHTTVSDHPGGASTLLNHLADSGVNLLAFSAIPMGGQRTQLMIFPERVEDLAAAAERSNLDLSGPEHALLCRGDDRLGALADIHRRLDDAHVEVYAASGVTADCGRFGYLLYVKSEHFERAAQVLGI